MSIYEMTAKIRQLKELQALIEEAQAEAETIKDEIKSVMTENGTEEMKVDVFKVRYTTVKSVRFDSTAFKRENAELYSRYSRETETRRFSVT